MRSTLFPAVKLLFVAALCSIAVSHQVAAESRDQAGGGDRQNSQTAREKDDNQSETGSELWSANCGRCHNKVSPDKYSDAQWELIVRHMRLRANLTGNEERQIVEFLRSAN